MCAPRKQTHLASPRLRGCTLYVRLLWNGIFAVHTHVENSFFKVKIMRRQYSLNFVAALFSPQRNIYVAFHTAFDMVD